MTEKLTSGTLRTDEFLTREEQAEAREIAGQFANNLALAGYGPGVRTEIAVWLIAGTLAEANMAGYVDALQALTDYIGRRTAEITT